jgi:hypothetical protein
VTETDGQQIAPETQRIWDMSRTLMHHWRHLQECQDGAHAREAAECQRLAATNKASVRGCSLGL